MRARVRAVLLVAWRVLEVSRLALEGVGQLVSAVLALVEGVEHLIEAALAAVPERKE